MSRLLRERESSQRFATADQVASVVLFLASDAADDITGINLAMDGEWTAQQSFKKPERPSEEPIRARLLPARAAARASSLSDRTQSWAGGRAE
jgi:hypothetical protein